MSNIDEFRSLLQIVHSNDIDIEDDEFLSNDNNIVIFNYDALVSELAEQYPDNKELSSFENIAKQLLIDHPRLALYINDKYNNNLAELLIKLHRYQKYMYNGSGIKNASELVLALCTQYTFYHASRALTRLYSDPDNNQFVFQHTDRPKVKINFYPDHIDIIYRKIYKLIDMDTQLILATYETITLVTINLFDPQSGFLFTKPYTCQLSCAMVYWRRSIIKN